MSAVTPAVPALLRRALLARRRKAGSGLGSARSPRRGDGYEFTEVRTYAAGDDPRHIDWVATARSDELQMRMYFEDHSLTLAACIDESASMRVGRARSAYECACDAARVWYAAASAEDRCTRITQAGLMSAPHLRGRSAAAFCNAYVSLPALSGAFKNALYAAATTLPRDAFLLIVSDFHDIEELAEPLRACARRLDTTTLIVRDPWYEGLPIGGFVVVRDAESGRSARLYVGRKERARYAAAVRTREENVLRTLVQHGMRTGILSESDVGSTLLQALCASSR